MSTKRLRTCIIWCRRLVRRCRSIVRAHELALFISLTLCFAFLFVFLSCRVLGALQRGRSEHHGSFLFHSCALASPQHLKHFAPAPLSTFSTFFDKYLFEPSCDKPLHLNDSHRSYSSDIQSMLLISEKVLRQFTTDHSIIVRNYTFGYSHLDRRRGSRYILHIQSFSRRTAHLRQDVFTFQNTFDGRCVVSQREIAVDDIKQAVYMILPYSARAIRLQWFLKQFDKLRDERVQAELVLAFCARNETDALLVTRIVQGLKNSNHIRMAFHPSSNFSRAACIREATKIVSNDSLLFIVDVDMYIYPEMFESCRLNSIQGSQVYFPVFYSLFPGNTRISEGNGFWRDTSYGMSCLYKSDFDAVKPYDGSESRFSGWGGEDVWLKDVFAHHPAYEVFRAVEPALRHKWHRKVCDPSSTFYDACLVMKYRPLGVARHVGKLLHEMGVDIEEAFAQQSEE